MSQLSLEQYREKLAKDLKSISATSKLSRDMSKVIAKSWLPDGKEIRKALLSDDQAQIRKAFEDHGCDLTIVKDHIIELDFDSLTGYIKTDEKPPTLYCAYCPKPTEFNVTDEDLRNWINEKDPNKITPDNPYIPATF
jgi:hypothetical protein